jgi:hypothetical protein
VAVGEVRLRLGGILTMLRLGRRVAEQLRFSLSGSSRVAQNGSVTLEDDFKILATLEPRNSLPSR